MSRRADRWWRPPTRRRPPQRARQRHLYTEAEMTQAFDLAYEAGKGDEAKRWRDLDSIRRACEADPEGFRQLSDALAEGGIEAARRLAASWGFTYRDDLLDVAEESGVTPLAEVDPGDLVADLERWLRGEQD